MSDPTDEEKAKAREILDREYGKDHPAARHSFTLTFMTTSHEHRVSELARALADAREKALEEAAATAELEPLNTFWTAPPEMLVSEARPLIEAITNASKNIAERIRALKGTP